MEDPAIYDSSHLVTADDGDRFVSALKVGDVFREYGQLWRVTDVEHHGDDVHLELVLND